MPIRRLALPISLLAALLLGFAATARAAGPTPDPGPPLYAKVSLQTDVPIVMSDGVRLVADILRPADASGAPVAQPLPVLLIQIPYNKSYWKTLAGGIYGGYRDEVVRHGYVIALVDVRGTGGSAGIWEAFSDREQQDGVEIAAWLAHQPWSDGRLGLFGGSYMGINQFFTAARHPVSLKAMFSLTPAEDIYRDVIWHGGMLDSGFMPFFLGIITVPGLFPPGYINSDPLGAAGVLAARGTQQFQAIVLAQALSQGDLAFDNAFYRSRSPGSVVRNIDVPAFVVGGWDDIFVRGEPRLYRALRMPPGRKELLVGPWAHVAAGLNEHLPAPGVPTLDRLAILWFDRWIKGIQNGIETYGPVTSYQVGTGKWTRMASWPPPGVEPQRFYLQHASSGSASHAAYDGSLSTGPPTRDAVETTLNPNIIGGICTHGTVQWTGGVVAAGTPCTDDERLVEKFALTYSTPPLSEPLHLAGPMSLTLHGATQARDTLWIATVSDVAPDGVSRRLSAGWLLHSRRALDLARSESTPMGDLIVPFHPFTRESLLPVHADEVDTLNVEIFNIDAVLKAGHRLRLTLQGGDFPHLLSPAPVLVNRVGGASIVHHGPAAPSYLTLTTLPSAQAPAAAGSGASRRATALSVRVRTRGNALRVSGRLRALGAGGAARCPGGPPLRVMAIAGGRRVASRRVRLGGGCRFATTLRIRGAARRRLAVVVRFAGTPALSPAVSRVSVRPRR